MLEKSKLFREQPILERGWKISFEIKPLGVNKKEYTNIIHATIGGDYGEHGDRTPKIFFPRRSTKLQFVTSIDDNPNRIFSSDGQLPLNQYSKVVVQQIQKGQQYYFEIFVNGKEEVSILNNKPRVFKNVKYYASSPFHTAANALIKEVTVEVYKHQGKSYKSTNP